MATNIVRLRETFLDRYKEAESLMASLGYTFLTAEAACEASGDSVNSSKLQLLRKMRNAIVHVPNADRLVFDNDARLSYLDAVIRRCRGEMDTVDKHLSADFCTLDDKVLDIIKPICKKHLQFYGVVDAYKRPIAVLSVYEFLQPSYISKTAKVSKMLVGRRRQNIVCVPPSTLWKDVPAADMVFCTKDGTPSSPVRGIVKL